MLRVSICSTLALAFLSLGVVKADDAKKKDDQGKTHMHATITKVDAKNDTLTVQTSDANGKSQEKTLHLSKDVKYLNAAGKEAKIDSFKAGDQVRICQKDEKVTEVRKQAEAKITKVDAKAGTITVKMEDQNGKEVERTFRLVEDTEYIDSTGRVAVLDVFRSGDDILFVEADGRIAAMKKADKQTTTGAKEGGQKSTDNDKQKSDNK